VYVYSYGDYFDPMLAEAFEEETGIRVILDSYDTAEEMYTVIENNATTYDCICTSDYMIEKMINKGMLAEIDKLNANGVRFVVLGNRERLSDGLNQVIDDCMARTSHNDTLTFIIFLSYSGKWDILQAAKKLALEIAADPSRAERLDMMDVADFSRYLVTDGIPDPDLIIRTSGENRLSNYMLWQSAYSEFLFVDCLWPEFRKPEFYAALESYAKRDRRYGKVK
jgi:undecaprenyl diphosphate synthase